MIRAAGVHPIWSGERGWEVSLAITDTHPATRLGSRDASGGKSTVQMRLRLPSLRAADAPKEAEIDQ